MNKIAVVGCGFVGNAVAVGFDLPHNQITKIDPRLGNSVEDLYNTDVEFAFIAVPTPMSDTGEINSSIVEDVAVKLFDHTKAVVILKSTVTPDIVNRLAKQYPTRFVYNPEFLTEANAEEDFINASFNIFGGNLRSTLRVAELYEYSSKCVNAASIYMTATEASFVKYTINTFLSTKVTFFNQLKDQTDRFDDVSFSTVTDAVKLDPRIGGSHMMVPGPDGRRGFGGACFPKDTNAFRHFSGGDFDLLEKVLDINTNYRLQYELDDREKEQNVKFGD